MGVYACMSLTKKIEWEREGGARGRESKREEKREGERGEEREKREVERNRRTAMLAEDLRTTCGQRTGFF